MSFIKKQFDNIRPQFEKGGKFEKFHRTYEAQETVFLQPNAVTNSKGAQIRDAVDLKRVMTTVIVAMLPCMIFGMWNVGYQHALATGQDLSVGAMFSFGAIKFLPILLVSYAVGLAIEFFMAEIKNHSVSEGFLVSGILIPLVMPATAPLWQVGVATAIAVILGKEVFGGTGYNILNPALTARAVMFFAYPTSMAGAGELWFNLDGMAAVDGFTGATVLDLAKNTGTLASALPWGFQDMFLGTIPGCIGETSALMCLVGAVILVITGIGSTRIMLSMVVGGLVTGYVLEGMGAQYFGADHAYYHLVAGGFAFGTVFMATDPVSAAQTDIGKIIYGFMAGFFSIIIRVTNPAYPEGVMLGILLANVLAPFIDYYVVESNKKRRLKRATV
jgi:Na+-transporting NADH:ubiquinone oxidoreductase subunit B